MLDGQARAHLHLPELRRRLWTLAGQNATPAASGIRLRRKARHAPMLPADRRGKAASLHSSRSPANAGRPAAASGIADSTGSPAAASCADPCCCWAAIRASANRPCCSRWPPRLPVPIAWSTFRAKRRSRKCGCARSGWGLETRESSLRRRPRSRHLATLSDRETPRLVVIDSIQPCGPMRRLRAGHRHPVRSPPQALIRFAKRSALPDPGRSRHQGRPDRRSARGRAYGRCGAVFEGEARTSSASCAR